MSFPVNAFQTCLIESLSKGEFFAYGGEWYLAVDYVGATNGPKVSAIQVTSASTPAGQTWVDPHPKDKVLRIAKPYSTMIFTEALPAAPTGQPGMPVTVGAEPILMAKLGYDEVLFTISGNRRPDKSDLVRPTQFSDWSLWIVKEGGTKVGNKPLFEVVSQ